MFVYNNFMNDSRVQKEAETLIKSGYETTVMALLDQQTAPLEIRNSINIIRIHVKPWNLALLDWVRNPQLFKPESHQDTQKSASYHNENALMEKPVKNSHPENTTVVDENIYNCDKGATFPDKHADRVPASMIYEKNTTESITCEQTFYGPNRETKLGEFLHKCLVLIKLASKFSQRLIKHIKLIIIRCVKFVLMPFHRYFCFISYYRKAYNLTANNTYDIYHAHDLNTLPVAYLAAKRDKAKLVYDSHELYVDRNKLKPSSPTWKFVQKRIEGILIRKADAVFTVNESLAAELAIRYKIQRPKVIMNTPAKMNKADLGILGNQRLRSALSIPGDQKLLIYVGGITFNRGLEELILSLDELPDCYLVCMGYGNEQFKQHLLDLALKTGVEDRFSFFGPVPTDEVIHFAAGADLGVAPIANACVSYYYCSPNKLFEYMNAGLPVIASNFPELEKVVLGHGIGLTFDPSSPSAIARAARLILDDPDLASEMRRNALSAVRKIQLGERDCKIA